MVSAFVGDDAALGWVTPESLVTTPATRPNPGSLLPRKRRRRGAKIAIATPLVLTTLLSGAYVVSTAVWPIAAQPIISSRASLPDIVAPQAFVSWPADGSAALTVEGFDTMTKSEAQKPMASIAKTLLVTMVLEKMPLELGEQGPQIAFGESDFWSYIMRDESALEIPVNGSMSEYQLLQGIMLGSANNYSNHIASLIWGDEPGAYREAALEFLERKNIEGIDPYTPSGNGLDNVATARGLNELGQLAMENPVFAEIVATKQVKFPWIIEPVTNHNELLSDPGVVGIKTGTERYEHMDQFTYFRNLLIAKDIEVDGHPIRLYTTVLEQPSRELRDETARSLLREGEAALRKSGATVPAGTVVGGVTTPWGGEADFVTTADATALGFNESVAKITIDVELGNANKAGDKVGTLTITGPIDTNTVDVTLSDDLPEPSILWRLSNPFEVYGLDRSGR